MYLTIPDDVDVLKVQLCERQLVEKEKEKERNYFIIRAV